MTEKDHTKVLNESAESAREYFAEHKISFYLEDAICQILESKSETPLKQLHIYFDEVRRGVNVLHRPFDYIRGTPRNRIAFVRKVSEIIRNETYGIDDIYELILLICPDFPKSTLTLVVQAVSYQLGMPTPDVLDPSSCASFQLSSTASRTFITAFKICFVYQEFLEVLIQAITTSIIKHLHVDVLAGTNPKDIDACIQISRGVQSFPRISLPELEKNIYDKLVVSIEAPSFSGGSILAPPPKSIESGLRRAFSASKVSSSECTPNVASVLYLECLTEWIVYDKHIFSFIESLSS